MKEAMVTARMSEDKKYDGAQVFKKLGTTPSKAINEFYDYVIKARALPFESEGGCKLGQITSEQWREAEEWSANFPYIEWDESETRTDKEILYDMLSEKYA